MVISLTMEKPLAISQTDALHLTNLAHEAGVVATVPFIYRFYPSVREARAQILASGISPKSMYVNLSESFVIGHLSTIE